MSIWRDGDETLNMMVMCARTLTTVSQFYTATKILQEIHAIKPHILVCVINVKYPSLILLLKSDEFHLINDNLIAIHRKNGMIQIINLNFISEIRIIRKS